MSDAQPASSEQKVPSAEKKPRSPLERTIVWGLIGAMVVVLGLEYRSKTGYGASLNALGDRFEGNDVENITLSEVQGLLSGGPSEAGREKKGINELISLKWWSLFKHYELTLVVDPEEADPVVVSFRTPDAAKPGWITAEQSRVADASALVDQEMPTMGGPPAGGIPGGGQPGGFGQAPGGFGGAPGGGGGGRRPQGGIAGLVGEDVIKEQLQISTEKAEEIAGALREVEVDQESMRELPDEERQKALEEARVKTEEVLAGLLEEGQLTRLKQLELQQSGVRAFSRHDVAVGLGLTDDQTTQIGALQDELRAAMREAFQNRAFDQIGGMRSENEDKLLGVLTDEQKANWETMKGEPGKLPERRGFGGGGRGPGGGGRGPGGGEGRGNGGGRPGRPPAEGSESPERPAAEESGRPQRPATDGE